jgi:hypothetical protein
VAKADFSRLADRVMARVSRQPGVFERLRDAWRRPWLPVGGLVAVAAAAAFFVIRPIAPTAAPAGVVVQSASTDSQTELRPVVLKTESGDAIIWLVETPDASANHRATPLPNDRPGVQTPVPPQQRPRSGEL